MKGQGAGAEGCIWGEQSVSAGFPFPAGADMEDTGLSPGVCIQVRKGNFPQVFCCWSQSFRQGWPTSPRMAAEFQ